MRHTPPHTGRPPSHADRGMVSAPHWQAAATGAELLRRGGSAVDAAIGANAVLCVVYPHMAGLGGDMFALIKPDSGDVEALNGSGPAALLATREWYATRGHDDDLPDRGELSALTTPGAVDGWRLAHERHGKLPWADLFADAIRLARNGVAVGRSLAKWYPTDTDLLASSEEAQRVFLPLKRPMRQGERLVNPDLADSFQFLADHGARAFYEGELAARICDGLGDSPLRAEDFARYEAEWVAPLTDTYRGHQLWAMPPSTQGFTALQILSILEQFPVGDWGDNTVDYIHHVAEATKLSFADRDAWLTDPDHEDIPIEHLLDDAYARERAALIKDDTARDMGRATSGVEGGWEGDSAAPTGDTCYLCAVDDDGLAVSLIQSIYHDFGSGIVAPGTGILLQNRGSFFSTDPEHPNSLEPDKRTLHTLIPALMLDPDGNFEAALGSMGGEGQPQTQVALVTRLLDFGYNAQEAIEAPRWLMGRTWGVESQDLWLESRMPEQVISALTAMGQPVAMLPAWDDNVGHAQMIRRTDEGFLEGAADPRGDGAAIGY